jgi:hypothetical protein
MATYKQASPVRIESIPYRVHTEATLILPIIFSRQAAAVVICAAVPVVASVLAGAARAQSTTMRDASIVTDTRGGTSSGGQSRPHTDGVAGVSVRRGIASVAPRGRRIVEALRSRARAVFAAASPPLQTSSGVRASAAARRHGSGLEPQHRFRSAFGGRPVLAPAPAILTQALRIGSLSLAENAQAKPFASALDRQSVKGPLIGAEISDSSRGPRGSAALCASVHCGTERGPPVSRGFVRVKAIGVLDQDEENVKMCVSGL